ncbi:alpha/beta fold hydrolase [Actinomadura verrucosospora]|uniref:3-oxoadipate enol-lactone hydrolase or 4-carboxymuconolactone decarboxylase n=1 Tax=Actinomadura verrucosospora TaxID=46165 RepID=A0A7D4A2G3_ACTVE|nr:alpha/beta hydrolase [Actinomadura verrucosospora]QKG23784.1 3-oxoadipate enol-lactone hydrolase or 4-carboxymuconolactone decarboxylase [Actinomadura verrucosospora]
MTTLTVGNARVPYRTEGSGPALVLVHGAGPGSIMWDGLLDRFTGHRTVILPDLSGSVPAEDDGAPLAIETLAAQVNAVIEDAVGGPADVVGFSLGAPTVAAAAALRPDLVRRLVPVAGLTNASDEYVRQYMTTWLDLAGVPDAFGRFATLTAYSRAFLNQIGHDAVEESRTFMQPTDGLLRQIDLVRRLDIRALLPRITAPTLVVGASRDQTIPVENHREMFAAIAGSEYAELDTGHVAMAERPEEFTKLVLDFLDRP